jgi:hypothetical protein
MSSAIPEPGVLSTSSQALGGGRGPGGSRRVDSRPNAFLQWAAPSPAFGTNANQPVSYRVAAAADSRSQEGAGKGTGGF